MDACNTVDALLSRNGFVSRPSARKRVIVDRVSQSRGQPGYQVTVDTTALSGYLKDSAGRTAHLIGIRLETAVVVTADAQNPPATNPATGHALRGCIYNVKLQGQDGFQYLRDVDGRDLIFDGWAREGRVLNSPPLSQDTNADTANPFTIGANLYPVPAARTPFGLTPLDDASGTRVRDISIDFDLIERQSMAGLIPLADVLDNNGQLLFTLRDKLPFGQGWGVDKYEVQGEIQTAVRVVFDLLYIDGVMTGRRWLVDDYTVTVVDGALKYPSFRHVYAAARWREEDVQNAALALPPYTPAAQAIYGALGNANLIGNLQVIIGGQSDVQGLTATQLLSRLRMCLETYPHGEINTWDRQAALPALIPIDTSAGQSNTGADYLQRMCEFFAPYAARAKNRPSGALSYSMDANGIPSGGLLRIIHRIDADLSEAPLKSARDCGCNMGSGTVRAIVDDRGNELLTTAPR